jgi:hypothetical protein
VIPQQLGDFSLGYVKYFMRTTSIRNQKYSLNIHLIKSRTVPALSLFNFFRYWHNRIQGVYNAKQSQDRALYPTAEAVGYKAQSVNN